MQKVETYYSAIEAKKGMQTHIYEGWRVYTCVSGGNSNCFLVVYEKEN